MTGSEFICGQLALKAWQDGFTEGLDGMRAVAFAIRNRVNAGWWGGDWISVLSHHADYSAKTEPYSTDLPDPRVYSFQCLLQEINGIFNNSAKDDVTIPAQPSFQAGVYKPVLYYAKLDEITNDWFLENISRRPDLHPRSAQVGQIFFFS
jgi:hypothetical protein